MSRVAAALLTLLSSIVAEPTPTLTPGDVFAGSYVCGNPAWLLLHVIEPTDDTRPFSAVFHFVYPSSTQHGAYTLSGAPFVSRGPRTIQLEPGAWISSAQGKVVPVGLLGVLSDDGATFSGEVLHGSCGRFEVHRVRLDVEPPLTSVQLGALSRAGAQDSIIHLKAEGPIMSESSRHLGSDGSRATLQMLLNGVSGLVLEARTNRQADQAALDAQEGAVGSAMAATAAVAEEDEEEEEEGEEEHANEEEATGVGFGASAGSPSPRQRLDRPTTSEPLGGDGRLQGQSRTQLPLVGLAPPSAQAYSGRLADGAALDMISLRRLIELRRFEDAYTLWAATTELDLQREAAVSIVAVGTMSIAVQALQVPARASGTTP